jgi:hypothetical protein
MTPPKLIALDIDGTLLDPEYRISALNRETLQKAHAAGAEIALATGRRHEFARPVAEELGIPVTLISSNGALITSAAGERLSQELIARPEALAMIAALPQYRARLIVVFNRNDGGALLAETLDELRLILPRWIDSNLRGIRLHSPIEEMIAEEPIQAMYCGKIAEIVAAEEQLRQNTELWSHLAVSRTQYHDRDLCLMDVLAAGCTKGSALEKLCQLRGIGSEAVMAVGDNLNDLTMLRFAGKGYVMGNASESMKARGFAVTRSSRESGVAWAVLDAMRAAGCPLD